MKILFLTLSTFDKVGGIQTVNKYFMQALEENGFSWKVISLHDSSGSEPGKIYCCGSSILKFVANVVHLADRDTVIVWNHISLGILLPYLKPLLRNKGSILLTYGTEVWFENLAPRKKRAFAPMDEIWAISSYTQERLIQTHGLEEEKFRLFPCCISTEGDTDFSDPYPPGRFDIMTLLRLDIEPKLSAVYNVVDALPALLQQGIPAHFTVVGRGNGEETLRSYVANLGLEEHVTFTGYVEDTRPYLEHCDVFSLMSDVEGFGIVYLEAMQYGKCCVAARNCGSVDVVLDGGTGLSVSVGDIPALEAAFLKLVADEPLRHAMGERGRQHLVENFTFESFKKNQQKLLERWAR